MLVPSEAKSMDKDRAASAQRGDETCSRGPVLEVSAAADMASHSRSGHDQALHDAPGDGRNDQDDREGNRPGGEPDSEPQTGEAIS
jgi:hypothetical protein